jgi:hypothetical protein
MTPGEIAPLQRLFSLISYQRLRSPPPGEWGPFGLKPILAAQTGMARAVSQPGGFYLSNRSKHEVVPWCSAFDQFGQKF